MGYITLDSTESNQDLKKSHVFKRLEAEFSNYFKEIENFRASIEKRDRSVLEKEAQIGELYHDVMDKYEGLIILDKVNNNYQDIIIGDEVNELHTEAYETALKWRRKKGMSILRGWSDVYKSYFEYTIFPPTDSFQEIIDELDSMKKLNEIFMEINVQYDTYFEHLNNLKELLLKNLALADDCEEI